MDKLGIAGEEVSWVLDKDRRVGTMRDLDMNDWAIHLQARLIGPRGGLAECLP
jgi:hypothetical protein